MNARRRVEMREIDMIWHNGEDVGCWLAAIGL
jgi:hypothetical protein